MPRKSAGRDAKRRIVDAALALAARQGWAKTSLADIAAEAGLPLLEVYGHYRSKPEIFAAFLHRIDAEVLAGESEEGEKPRDRLFDTIMRRFDALSPHKEVIRKISGEAGQDPLGLVCTAPSLLRSMAWMLEASGVSTAGWRGTMRTHLLAAIYLSVVRVWLADESADAMKTMAALDRRLRTAEAWLGLGGGSDVAVQQSS
jgi:AcrR family transcriptional regulator